MMDSTTRGLLVAIAVLLGVALGFSMLTGGMMGPGMGPAMMNGRGMTGWAWGFGMGLGGLAMLAFWGVVILGVVLLVRSLGNERAGDTPGSPLDIVKRRYATGEITREQYEQLRRDLEQ